MTILQLLRIPAVKHVLISNFREYRTYRACAMTVRNTEEKTPSSHVFHRSLLRRRLHPFRLLRPQARWHRALADFNCSVSLPPRDVLDLPLPFDLPHSSAPVRNSAPLPLLHGLLGSAFRSVARHERAGQQGRWEVGRERLFDEALVDYGADDVGIHFR